MVGTQWVLRWPMAASMHLGQKEKLAKGVVKMDNGVLSFQTVVLLNFLANETKLTILYKVDIEG